jgi:hypothetical protein
MTTSEEIEILRDALDHIMRTANSSRTQTRRLRWITKRCECALDGNDDWKEIDLPKKAPLSLRESKMQTFIEKNIDKEFE